MKRVEWTDAALTDLNEVKAYLSQFGPDVAQDAVRRLLLSARWLLDYPYAGPLIGYRRWRKWKPKGLRYLLVYQPDANGISIARVRHERNDWRAGSE